MNHDDFMQGGQSRSVPFENVGDTVTGLVLGPPEKRNQLNEDGTVRTFDSGDPRTMFMVNIQTELRDPTDPTDTGIRSLYLKWKSQEAVVAAVRLSGAKGLRAGGLLTLTLTGFGTKTNPKYSPPKLWSAVYVPPEEGTGFMDTPQPAQAPPPPPPPPPPPSAPQDMMARLRAQAAASAARLDQTAQHGVQHAPAANPIGAGIHGQSQPDQPGF
jgi:hypothetical protein